MSYCLSVGLKGGNGKEKLYETGPHRLLRPPNEARNPSLTLTENPSANINMHFYNVALQKQVRDQHLRSHRKRFSVIAANKLVRDVFYF